MIIIEPVGGLSNRMRVIASAMLLQKKLKCKLVCIWNENTELNAPFHVLFENISGLRIQSKSKKYTYLKSSNQNTLLKKFVVKILNKILGIDYCIKQKDFKELFGTKNIDIFEFANKHQNIYIHTGEEFGNNFSEFQRFKPIKEIQDKIEQVGIKSDETIGIHIRRTDNIQSIENSPNELFIAKLYKEINRNINVVFFLSTDDPNIEKELINRFCDKIITREKVLNRNTITGIQDAVVDMYCLSKTALIYGSYWSSFSDISSRIGKIKFVPVTKEVINQKKGIMNPTVQ